MKKKFFSLLLAVLMIISFAGNAFAYEFVTAENYKEVVDNVSNVLNAIEEQKGIFGLDGVDFSVLYLGNEIPAYELKSSGSVRIDRIQYYPVLEQQNWVATAIVSYDEFGKMNVQISKSYVETYNKKSADASAF